MKKLFSFVICLLIVFSGLLVFQGCKEKENFDGYYFMVFNLDIVDGKLVSATNNEMDYDVYVKYDNLTIEKFTFKKEESTIKTLIDYEKIVRAKKELMPKFDVEVFDDIKYYKDYTNLSGNLGTNLGRQLFKQYVKTESIPQFHQNSLVANFGEYVLTGICNDGNHVEEIKNGAERYILNGNMKHIYGTENAVETIYEYIRFDKGIWEYGNAQKTIKFSFEANAKLRVYKAIQGGFQEFTKV